MWVLFQHLLFGFVLFRLIELLHDLLEKENIYFIQSEGVSNHHDPRDQKSDVEKAT